MPGELSDVRRSLLSMDKPLDFQVAVDTADPHAMADWWAETLGWTVEKPDEAFIRRMIAEGHATEADTSNHNGGLVWSEAAAISRPDGRRIYFQLVPEAKTVKNRVHLDLRVGQENRDTEIAALVARGATVLGSNSQGPFTWTVMTDPEGNEFCVA